MKKPCIIATLQQKGGVAKTTTTISLAVRPGGRPRPSLRLAQQSLANNKAFPGKSRAACACEKTAGAQPLRVCVFNLEQGGAE